MMWHLHPYGILLKLHWSHDLFFLESSLERKGQGWRETLALQELDQKRGSVNRVLEQGIETGA